MYISLAMIVFSPYLAFVPLMYLLYKLVRQHEWGDWNRNTWTKGIFILFLWSFLVGLNQKEAYSMLASFVLLLFLAISIYLQDRFQTEEQIEQLFSKVFVVSIGSAIIGLLENWNIITYSPVWWKFLLGTRSIVEIEEAHRIAGTFNNPNLAGTWYAAMIMIGFYFFQQAKGYRRLFYLSGIALFSLVLMMTESRGAVIGCFLGFVIYMYFAGHKKKMLFLMFLLLAGTALMLHRPEWFPRGEILFSSIRDRQAIWENTFYMFMLKPITGWGLMGIYYADPKIYHYLRVFHAHNLWLTMATTLGVFGLAILGWLKWSLLQEIRNLYERQCRLTPLLGGIIAMIFGQGLFDFTIMSPQIGLLLIGSWSFVYSLSYSYRHVTVSPLLPWRTTYSKHTF